MAPEWFFWAIVTAVIWGVGQVLAKGGLAYFSPLAYNIVSTLLDFPILTAYALFLGVDFSRFRLADFLILTFITATYLLYFYAVSLAAISLSGTILSAYPLSTIFFSVVFLSERLNPAQWLAALLIMGGVILLGWPEKVGNRRWEGWFWLAVISLVLIGFGDFLAKSLVDRVGVANYLFFFSWAFLPGLVLAYVLDRHGRRWPRLSWRWLVLSLLGAAFIGWGSVPFLMALASGPASLVSPLVSSSSLITVFLARIFLKERVRRIQLLGIGLAIVGIILISF